MGGSVISEPELNLEPGSGWTAAIWCFRTRDPCSMNGIRWVRAASWTRCQPRFWFVCVIWAFETVSQWPFAQQSSAAWRAHWCWSNWKTDVEMKYDCMFDCLVCETLFLNRLAQVGHSGRQKKSHCRCWGNYVEGLRRTLESCAFIWRANMQGRTPLEMSFLIIFMVSQFSLSFFLSSFVLIYPLCFSLNLSCRQRLFFSGFRK